MPSPSIDAAWAGVLEDKHKRDLRYRVATARHSWDACAGQSSSWC